MERQRSIPARTGEPRLKAGRLLVIKVYPRAYGGTQTQSRKASGYQGLSPRVRGNPYSKPEGFWLSRSIPARTGEPVVDPFYARCRAVYPRAYGGTTERGYLSNDAVGLSPRVRGNLPDGQSLKAVWTLKVYPRAYGGTPFGLIVDRLIQRSGGLSPRVRGNLIQTRSNTDQHAGGLSPRVRGNPIRLGADGGFTLTVYPRAYGGTPKQLLLNRSWPVRGLSPRVRGNRWLLLARDCR